MSDADIKSQCSRCLGTGQEETGIPPVKIPCSACGATGYQEKDKIDTTDLNDKLADLKEKLDETKAVCDDIWDKVKKM